MLLENKRIFVVEDDVRNLALTSVYLRQHGALISHERWGLETPQMILNYMPVDVILMDLMFPNNISGFDIFDQIRQVKQLAHIPVVIVSSADPDKVVPIALEKGFAGFIGKPISNRIGKYLVSIMEGKKIWITHDLVEY